MKTTEQIAADCGLESIGTYLLKHFLSGDEGEQPGTSEVVNALYRRIEALEMNAAGKEQQDLNVRWLIEMFDQAHRALKLPPRTWQERVEQVVTAVEKWQPLEQEDVFLVSQTRNGGEWNKFVKSQYQFWSSADAAQMWLDEQEDWFKRSNKVFKVRMNIVNVQRAGEGV